MNEQPPEYTADKHEILSTLTDPTAPEDRGASSNDSDGIGFLQADTTEVPDFVRLYFTLVLDGAVPRGYLREFVSLEEPVRTAAERADRRNAGITNFSAAGWLHLQRKSLRESEKSERDAIDQLVLASEIKPRKFRSRCHQQAFQGPSARQDAEAAERAKWLHVLADILLSTPTPMGDPLRADPAARKILGAGRRAATIRARVRTIRKFMAWLAAANALPCPDTYLKIVEYMQIRHSEPCPRGSLKLIHVAFVKELSGVREKFTDVPLYSSARKELMASTPAAQESKQAHRYPVVVLAALEDFLADVLLSQCTYVSSHGGSCYNLGQHYALRITVDWEPSNLRIEGGAFLAKLTRSKTLGSDKPVSSRLVAVDQEAYIRNDSWLEDGLHLLQPCRHHSREITSFPRPVTISWVYGFESFGMIRRLVYSPVSLVSSATGDRRSSISVFRITGVRTAEGTSFQQRLLRWVLQRRIEAYLGGGGGGGSARGSEQCDRLAKYNIAQVQREVVKCIWDKDSQDPLSESDTLRELAEFFRANLVDEEKSLAAFGYCLLVSTSKQNELSRSTCHQQAYTSRKSSKSMMS